MKIEFNGKSFCFTGLLSQLKRTHAEREVRERLGLTQKNVNPSLNYLVIGSVPSPAWKYGNYGNKIEQAISFQEDGSKINVISEHDFMEALENSTSIVNGDIDCKLLMVRYKSLLISTFYDHNAIEVFLTKLQSNGFHVTASLEPPYIYQNLYNKFQGKDLENLLYLNVRIVKELHIGYNSQQLMDDIAIEFEKIKGLDGEISFSEKKEGTASFISLLKSIPQNVSLV